MRNYYQTITIACCMAMSASPLAIWAQSGDEQGLEIPRNLQLQQDSDIHIVYQNGLLVLHKI